MKKQISGKKVFVLIIGLVLIAVAIALLIVAGGADLKEFLLGKEETPGKALLKSLYRTKTPSRTTPRATTAVICYPLETQTVSLNQTAGATYVNATAKVGTRVKTDSKSNPQGRDLTAVASISYAGQSAIATAKIEGDILTVSVQACGTRAQATAFAQRGLITATETSP